MMQKKADISFKDNRFFLTGDLNFLNVMSVYEKSLPQLKHCSAMHFDFSQLKSSDSAGLSLIIEWIKLARAQQKSIQFTHLSDEIMSLAKSAGMDGLILSTDSH